MAAHKNYDRIILTMKFMFPVRDNIIRLFTVFSGYLEMAEKDISNMYIYFIFFFSLNFYTLCQSAG